jgi:poly-gamma-glutamate capsule biosynthesis protein CapA/YwtB (metallophosphatase superfamily)
MRISFTFDFMALFRLTFRWTTSIFIFSVACCTLHAQQPAPTAPSTPYPSEQKTEEHKPLQDVELKPVENPNATIWVPIDPASQPTPDDVIVFAAVGDTMLGSTFPDTSGKSLPPEDGAQLLDEVAPVLRAADLAFGNLEGPLYDGKEPSYKCARKAVNSCYAFRVPTRYAKLLREAGYRVMGTANNHGNDFGPVGLASSAKALDEAGIVHSGVPGQVARMLVKGKKIALIAFTTYPNFNDFLDLENARAMVEDAAKETDIVIVSFHGGAEGADRQHVPAGDEKFLGEDRGDLRKFTHAMIDAGASVVIGHGPHVVRGMELYKDRLIAYSLGNFATYGHINLRGVNGLSLVLEVHLAMDGKFMGGKAHPVYQVYPGGPHLDPEGKVLDVLRSLSKSDFGKNAVVVQKDGELKVPDKSSIDEETTMPPATNLKIEQKKKRK